MKHSIVAILLFFVLIGPFAGTYIWLQHQKTLVKKQVKKQMMTTADRSDLVLLKFSQKEISTRLRWEHSREFEFDGHMFDIIESLIVGDSIHYWCWPDHDETRLNRQLEEVVANALGSDPKHKKSQDRLLSFAKTLYFQDVSDWSALSPESTQISFPFYSIHYSFQPTPPLTPPPQLS